MKKSQLIIYPCIIALFSGCSDIESEFIDALNDDMDSRRLCMSGKEINVSMWELNNEYYLAEPGRFDDKGKVKAIPRLIEKDYLSSELTKIKDSRYEHKKVSGYKLTDKGNKYFVWNKPICIGERTATEVVEYTESGEMGGMTFSKVKYTYDIDLNELGADLDIEQELLNKMIYGRLKGEGVSMFIKTNKGWRLQGGW